MHHQPGRLVDDDELVVLEHDVERDVLAPRAVGLRAPAASTVIVSPALTRWPGSRIVRPPIVTAPARISALSRERDSSAMRAASTRSRPPAGGRTCDFDPDLPVRPGLAGVHFLES